MGIAVTIFYKCKTTVRNSLRLHDVQTRVFLHLCPCPLPRTQLTTNDILILGLALLVLQLSSVFVHLSPDLNHKSFFSLPISPQY